MFHVLLVVISLSSTVYCNQTTVLVPSNTSRENVGLLIIPGAQIGANQYIPLGSRIQEDSETHSIWLATVGDWIGNLVNPLQMDELVKDAITEMKKVGLSENAPIFLAAHSLGGVFLDMYIRENKTQVAGVILYGSYISKSIKLADYPVPVITMAGDQDGMCRMTRIFKDFGQLQAYTPRTPVVVVPGVNHSQIASGTMPQLVQTNDLIADKTEKEAHTLLAEITNSFIVLNGPKIGNEVAIKSANSTLEGLFNNTADVARPFLETLEMDGQGLGTWAHWTSTVLSSVISTATNVNGYGVEVDDLTFIAQDPQVTFHNETTINFTVPIHNDLPFNPMDISLSQQTPNQQLVKSLAHHKFVQYLPNATFSKQVRHCNDSNLAGAFFMELSLPIDYMNRYESKGRQLKFNPDKVMDSEEAWLVTDVHWDYSKEGVAYVTSPSYSDNNVVLCKVITGSRFFEWMLIDSFKKSY